MFHVSGKMAFLLKLTLLPLALSLVSTVRAYSDKSFSVDAQKGFCRFQWIHNVDALKWVPDPFETSTLASPLTLGLKRPQHLFGSHHKNKPSERYTSIKNRMSKNTLFFITGCGQGAVITWNAPQKYSKCMLMYSVCFTEKLGLILNTS